MSHFRTNQSHSQAQGVVLYVHTRVLAVSIRYERSTSWYRKADRLEVGDTAVGVGLVKSDGLTTWCSPKLCSRRGRGDRVCLPSSRRSSTRWIQRATWIGSERCTPGVVEELVSPPRGVWSPASGRCPASRREMRETEICRWIAAALVLRGYVQWGR